MTFVATLIVLSIIGIADSFYLVSQHLKHKELVCPLDHDCSVVTESKWSRIFFVRNEVLGLVFFIIVFLGALILAFIPSYSSITHLTLLTISTFGLAFSIFLILIQIYKIRDYCFYCIISAIVTTLIFLNNLYLYLH